jgi:hypothetical protein
MSLQVVTETMIIFVIAEEGESPYLKVYLKDGKANERTQKRIEKLPFADRRFITMRGTGKEPYWVIRNFQKHYNEFPEFKEAGTVLKNQMKLI